MDAKEQTRSERIQEHLRAAAELTVEGQVEEGVFLNTPHYSVIERVAVNLGRDVSRQVQQRAAREVAAEAELTEPCPECSAACEVSTQKRKVQSIDGPVELVEAASYCRRCRRAFFPSTGSDGA